MKLFTEEINKKLEAQYKLASDLENQVVVCKIFHVFHNWTWYLLNSDPVNPDYLWAIVDGFAVEIGSVSRSELESLRLMGLPMERDKAFKQRNALEVYKELLDNRR